MKAKDLTPGQEFKIAGKRKLRKIKEIITLKASDLIPESQIGKLLIVLDNCKQIILDPNTEVIIAE